MSASRIEILEDGEGSSKIVTIRLKRSEAKNALTYEMLCDLADAFRRLGKDGNVVATILIGEGGSFSSGIDLSAARRVFDGDEEDMDNDVIHQMESCPFPIIGAVDGPCITGGLEIALGCDVLIATESAFFMDTHCRWGIMPSWGLSQKLPRMIGANRARWFSLTSNKIDAWTAKAWGLVIEVVPKEELLQEAMNIANSMRNNRFEVVKGYKKVLNDGLGMTLADGRKMERRVAWEAYRKMGPEDYERMKRFSEKKKKKKKTDSIRTKL